VTEELESVFEVYAKNSARVDSYSRLLKKKVCGTVVWVVSMISSAKHGHDTLAFPNLGLGTIVRNCQGYRLAVKTSSIRFGA